MILDDLVPQLKARKCKVEIMDDAVVRVEVNQNFVLSHRDCASSQVPLVVTCRQSNSGGAFTIDTMNAAEIVCEANRETPDECAQKIMRQLEQLGCLSPFGNRIENDRRAYSEAEEVLVTQRLAELGYV